MEEAKRKHLEWAVRSRARNQAASLRLVVLFADHVTVWRTKKYSRAAQELTAVAFSLWRAAFLAEKTGKRGEVFAHAKAFLERMVEDNAIAYPQDKGAREWTFNYYTRNARTSLKALHAHWSEVAPEYVDKTRNATARWDYCQELLEETVAAFEGVMAARKPKAPRATTKSPTKTRREKRKIVREIVLASRKNPAR